MAIKKYPGFIDVHVFTCGAGGVAIDHQGQDLGEAEFAAGKTYELLAGSGTAMRLAAGSIDKG